MAPLWRHHPRGVARQRAHRSARRRNCGAGWRDRDARDRGGRGVPTAGTGADVTASHRGRDVTALGALLVPLVAILYAVDVVHALPVLALTVVLGSIGFAAVGTFYAGVTVRLRAREVMLPLLVLPIVAPLLLAAVKATTAALAGDPLGELPAWLELLAGFDVVMLIAGAGTYGFLLEE